MSRTPQYQKLSLQLDAENKKLKAKLDETKKQLNGVKQGATGVNKSFTDSFGNIGGPIGSANSSIKGLVGSITSVNPVLGAMGAATIAAGVAFKDLTVYTDTWEGSLSDAGRQLASLQTGFSSFMKSASQARGQALAEGGIGGWFKELADQVLGLQTGMTQAAFGAQVASASIVNDSLLKWRQGLLDTTVSQQELRAEVQELYNQFKDKALIPEERLQAVNLYKERAVELYQIQKDNAENELEYLLKEAQLSGNSFEENLAIEQAKARIAELERDHLKLLGRSIEHHNQIRNEIEKNQVALYDFNTLMRDTFKGGNTINIDAAKDTDPFGIMEIVSGFEMVEERADVFTNAVGDAQQTLIDGWIDMAHSVGGVAMGISIAKDNWAAMASTVITGGLQVLKSIEGIKEAQRGAVLANQAEGVSAAVASGAKLPFPANLIAIATGVATVLTTIAPFVGSFARGTEYVPRTGMAMVHKGEKILRKGQDENNRSSVEFIIRGDNLYGVLDEYNRRRGNSY